MRNNKIHTIKNQSFEDDTSFKNNKLNYLLVYLLIGFSATPFFSGNVTLLFIVCFLTLIIFWNKGKRFDNAFIWFIVLLTIMIIGQAITFSFISLRSTTGVYTRFLFPYLVLKIIDKKFIDCYLKTIFVFAIISLIFWIPENFVSDFQNLLRQIPLALNTDIESNENFLIYNVEGHEIFGIIRNCGFTYEPGAFGIFLIIAILLNILKTKKLINKYNVIIFIVIITTFSTAAFISIAFIILGYYLFTGVKIYVKILIVPLSFFIMFSYYYKLPFLSEKIESQITMATSGTRGFENRGRFGSALVDIKEIKKYPFFGKGKAEETRWAGHSEFLSVKQRHRVNGLAAFALKFGLIVFVVYILMLYKSFRSLCIFYGINKNFSFIFLGAMLLEFFSQICLQWSISIILLYLWIIYRTKEPVLQYSESNRKSLNIKK